MASWATGPVRLRPCSTTRDRKGCPPLLWRSTGPEGIDFRSCVAPHGTVKVGFPLLRGATRGPESFCSCVAPRRTGKDRFPLQCGRTRDRKGPVSAPVWRHAGREKISAPVRRHVKPEMPGPPRGTGKVWFPPLCGATRNRKRFPPLCGATRKHQFPLLCGAMRHPKA